MCEQHPGLPHGSSISGWKGIFTGDFWNTFLTLQTGFGENRELHAHAWVKAYPILQLWGHLWTGLMALAPLEKQVRQNLPPSSFFLFAVQNSHT